ncbi:MAG: 3' terminal RNA ribose 2'-O-methyltransferase Hen1, partial [bacterium]|nr:3' terminal RNA ribose 2'-O-methyltransferase Hen1 [bacterium]
MKRGEGWLETHPVKEVSILRYSRHKKSYMRQLLEQLMGSDSEENKETADSRKVSPEEMVETQLNLNQVRLETVLSALKSAGAGTVIDLGCGEGRLLRLLLKEKSIKKIAGV